MMESTHGDPFNMSSITSTTDEGSNIQKLLHDASTILLNSNQSKQKKRRSTSMRLERHHK